MNFNTGSSAQPPPVYPPQTLSLGFLRGKQELFWVAGLSLVNSLLAQFDAHIRFPTGMGITQASDAIFLKAFAEGGALAHGAALVFALLAAGVVCLFAWLTGRGSRTVFMIAIVLYGLDALLCLVFQDWFSVAFHGWMLFKLIQAWRATG